MPAAYVLVAKRKGFEKRFVKLNGKGNGQVVVPFSRKKVKAVYVSLVNASTRFKCGKKYAVLVPGPADRRRAQLQGSALQVQRVASSSGADGPTGTCAPSPSRPRWPWSRSACSCSPWSATGSAPTSAAGTSSARSRTTSACVLPARQQPLEPRLRGRRPGRRLEGRPARAARRRAAAPARAAHGVRRRHGAAGPRQRRDARDRSVLGGHLDLLSMYLIASFAAAYALMRLVGRGRCSSSRCS